MRRMRIMRASPAGAKRGAATIDDRGQGGGGDNWEGVDQMFLVARKKFWPNVRTN